MMESILEQSEARRRHRVAPLLKEREQYLSHLLQRGTSQHRVRSVAAYLIHIIRLMELTTLRKVDLEEIKKAGECWANYRGVECNRDLTPFVLFKSNLEVPARLLACSPDVS